MSRAMQREMWFYGPTYHYIFLRILYLSVLSILFLPIATNSNENNNHMTEIACEWFNFSISCHGSAISIVEAFYGRLEKVNCVGGSFPTNWSTNCHSPNATKVIREKCNNHRNCTLNPDNVKDIYNSMFGGDPCPHTGKYLSVNYTCLQVNTASPPPNAASTIKGKGTELTSDDISTSRFAETDVSVSTTSASHCQCHNDSKRNVQWNQTECGRYANQSCPNNKRRHKAIRECSNLKSKGVWKHPNLIGCITEEIERMRNETDELMKRNFSVNSTTEMMSRVKNISECNDLYGGDLYELTRIMVDLVKFSSRNNNMLNYSEADNLTEMVLNSTGNLLLSVYDDTWMDIDLQPADRSQTAERLLDALETSCTVLAKAIDSPRSIKKSAAGIELQINVFNITQTASSTSTVSFETADAQVDINLEDVKKRSNKADGTLGLGRTVFILYDDIAKRLYAKSEENCSSKNDTCVNDTSVVASIISKVLSASIVSNDPHSTETPVRLTLHHQSELLNSNTASCVFWKFSENGFGGHWSKDGLTVTSTSSDKTTCQSCHLTNFAILMSAVETPEEHKFALHVITYIGCTISIVCLALALFTFCVFRNLQSDRNTIHKNLVFCLLVSELIFVFGVIQYDNKLLCAVVAGFLHYFLLASFAWMCLEGVQLYVLLIEVFESEKSRVKWYYLGGYGIPALIVSISVSVNIYMKVTLTDCNPEYFHYDYGAYGTNDYCWLSRERGFIWAFVGPALAIIAMNLVMLGVAIYTMCKHVSASASWKNKSTINAMGSWLRGAAILVVLLGTTWSFGLGMLYDSGHVTTMAYIFTILNSLQGFFIFVFHCLVNEKVQSEYQRAIQRSTWVPENVKVKFGGASETPNNSTTDRKPFFQRMLIRKRKDSSSSSCVPKTDSTAFGHGSLVHGSTVSESAPMTEPSGVVELQDTSHPSKVTERHETSYTCSSERPTIRIQGNGAVQKLATNTG